MKLLVKDHILELDGQRLAACATLAAYRDVQKQYRNVLIGSIKPLTPESFPRTYRIMLPTNIKWEAFASYAEDSVFAIDKEKLARFGENLVTITFGSIEELDWVIFFLGERQLY